ncbi:PsbP domain-containing protein 3 chloroplastic [Bienertia sinuspersici]
MAAASTATAGSTATTSFLRLSTSSSLASSTLSFIHQTQHPEHGVGSSGTRRREALLQIAVSAVVQVVTTASVSLPARALDDASAEFRIYSDDANKYKISIPQVSVVITGIGPDFTRLESFGKVDAFAERLYYIEYTLQQPGESRRHIYSAIGMANNGWYNRLYTVTGQVNSLGFTNLKFCRHQIAFLKPVKTCLILL